MSREAEQSVLGALMLDADVFDRVGAVLQASDFADGFHRRIWAAISGLIVANKPADPITVYAALGTGEDEHLAYLGALVSAVPSAKAAIRYAEIVRVSAMQRAIRQAAQDAQDVADGEAGPTEKLDAIGAIFGKLERRSASEPKAIGDLLAQRLDAINELAEGSTTPGWATPHPFINKSMRGGLRPGSLIILAARPGVGKSSFAMDLAMRFAADRLPALFISQEMPADELTDRAMSNASRVAGNAIGTGRLSDDDWRRLTEGVQSLAGLPLWLDDKPAQTLLDIRAKARSTKGLKLLVVDYLQLCSSQLTKESRTAQVGEISRGLKALAKELGIAVVALSQLNREVEKRLGKRPQLSDLRDSGEIEQDADVVWFLWPLAEEQMGDDTRRVGIEIAKNRSGSKGAAVLRFHPSTQQWQESTERVSDFTARNNSTEL